MTTEDLVGAESLQGHGGGVQLLAVPASGGVRSRRVSHWGAGWRCRVCSGRSGVHPVHLGVDGAAEGRGAEPRGGADLRPPHARDSTLAVDGAMRYVQTTTYTFDVSVPEIFVPLCCGGVVALAKPDALLDFDYCEQLIRQQAVTMWGLVPSVLAAFVAPLRGSQLPAPRAADRRGAAAGDVPPFLCSARGRDVAVELVRPHGGGGWCDDPSGDAGTGRTGAGRRDADRRPSTSITPAVSSTPGSGPSASASPASCCSVAHASPADTATAPTSPTRPSYSGPPTAGSRRCQRGSTGRATSCGGAQRRGAGVHGAHRLPGQGQRLPHRAGGDRGRGRRGAGRAGGRGHRAGGHAGAQAHRALRHARGCRCGGGAGGVQAKAAALHGAVGGGDAGVMAADGQREDRPQGAAGAHGRRRGGRGGGVRGGGDGAGGEPRRRLPGRPRPPVRGEHKRELLRPRRQLAGGGAAGARAAGCR